MEGHYTEKITNADIYRIARELCEEEIKKIEQICYKYGDETEIKRFNVL